MYAIYLRKSRADIEAEMRGEMETLARHEKALTELAAKQNLSVAKIYKEIVSGDSIATRPQMQMLLQDISEKKYEGVLVMEIERLARGDTIDQGIVAQTFKNSDTKIITPIKTYDPNNEFDEEYFEFSLFMSRREYKTIKRRMQTGRLAAIKEGNYISPIPPYGYRKVSPESKIHTLEIVEEEAAVVRQIFDMYISGIGPNAIATKLNQMGVKPAKNDKWEKICVKKILRSVVYAGKLQWKSKSSGDTVYQGLHPAIISDEVYRKANIQREERHIPSNPGDKPQKNYYHKILICKNCGHSMRRRYVSATGKAYMLCERQECRGKVVCANIEDVDKLVITAVRYRLSEIKKINSVSQRSTVISTAPLESELHKLTEQRTKLCDFLEKGIYTPDVYIERNKLLSARIADVNASIEQIKKTNEAQIQLSPKESELAATQLLNEFDSADETRRAQLIRSLISKIYYTKTIRGARTHTDDTDINVDVVFL